MFHCVAAHRPGSSPLNKSTLQFLPSFFSPLLSLVLMNQLSGRSTHNSAAAMLDSSGSSSKDPSSSVANSLVSSGPVTSSPSFVLTAHDLSQAFS